MAGRRPVRPRAVTGIAAISVDDPQVDRAINVVRDAVATLQSDRQRFVTDADLVIGTNKIRHGLGRAVVGYSITPSIATIAFAHALDRENPRPDREVWIDVVGSDMPGAVVEVW